MEVQYYWWLLAIGLVVAELFTGTFYLLILAVGGLAGGMAAMFAFTPTVQVLTAAIVTVLGWSALWTGRRRKDAKLPPDQNPDVLLDVGGSIQVDEWSSPRQTQVRYRGAQWSVELADRVPGAAVVGTYRIESVRGSTLVVTPT